MTEEDGASSDGFGPPIDWSSWAEVETEGHGELPSPVTPPRGRIELELCKNEWMGLPWQLIEILSPVYSNARLLNAAFDDYDEAMILLRDTEQGGRLEEEELTTLCVALHEWRVSKAATFKRIRRTIAIQRARLDPETQNLQVMNNGPEPKSEDFFLPSSLIKKTHWKSTLSKKLAESSVPDERERAEQTEKTMV